MARPVTALLRPLAAVAVAATAFATATQAEAPAWPPLIGMIGGAVAILIGWNAFFFPEPPAAPQAAAGEAHALAPQILAGLPEPMLLLDRDRIAAANSAARRLFGETVEGHDVRMALRHPLALQQLADHQSGAREVEITGLGESDRRWLMTIAPLGDGMRLVRLLDTSEAQAAEKMRVDFVANASHELRTPLATILGFIETLRDEAAGGDREVRSRFLGIMAGEGKRMHQLIEDLMSLSRIEADRYRPPTDPIDLVPLVDEVKAGCAQLLAEKGNALEVENDSRSTLVAGDRAQLLQLIRNLVVNAAKYGREGAPITVSFADAGTLVRMTVRDRGEGIAAEHLPRLTERFYRVDPGRSRAGGGTGLGLAIVKHIVWRHRGRLDLRSTPGEGTSVHVLLPRPAAPDAAEAMS